MIAHTPGPWGKKQDGEPTFIPMKAIYCERLGFQVAFINTDSKRREEEAQANARLIAAAPDLLKALEDLYSICHGSVIAIQMDQARAAIAAAKVEQ